ncbi:MAG: NAD(P)/FAD-dependent oxidoreductase [Promethearchaeota archaeon]
MNRVGIVGAGAAGLLAANELVSSPSSSELEVHVFEEGRDVDSRACPLQEKQVIYCAHCHPCNIMSGVGGAGTWSSGILNLSPKIGGDLVGLAGSEQTALEILESIDDFFVKNGAPRELFDPASKKSEVEELKRRAAAANISFVPIKQRLMGTENSPIVVKNIRESLEGRGVKFHTETRVGEVEVVGGDLVLVTDDGQRPAFKFVLLAPGRVGMAWLGGVCEKMDIPYDYGPIDIGVRVEVPAIIMEPVCSIQRDPKFHIVTSRYDDFLRTFCVNHEGYVVQETYEDGIVGVNGHSYIARKSENTNFALLNRVTLTEPLEDSARYGHAIARQTTILGGKNPLVQTLGDLRKGRRSTPKRIARNPVQPTLSSATPGDLAMAYPHRILSNIAEGLESLDRVIPGIANDSTLMYAPEVKYSANLISVDEFLETSVENLFVAGDGAGLSRGIVGAALTGILAARGILRKL